MIEYRIDELPDVSRWIAEEIEALELRIDPDEKHALPDWIKMVTSSHSQVWNALQMQG